MGDPPKVDRKLGGVSSCHYRNGTDCPELEIKTSQLGGSPQIPDIIDSSGSSKPEHLKDFNSQQCLPLASWEGRNEKEPGNYYDTLYRDYCKDPFLAKSQMKS